MLSIGTYLFELVKLYSIRWWQSRSISSMNPDQGAFSVHPASTYEIPNNHLLSYLVIYLRQMKSVLVYQNPCADWSESRVPVPVWIGRAQPLPAHLGFGFYRHVHRCNMKSRLDQSECDSQYCSTNIRLHVARRKFIAMPGPWDKIDHPDGIQNTSCVSHWLWQSIATNEYCLKQFVRSCLVQI